MENSSKLKEEEHNVRYSLNELKPISKKDFEKDRKLGYMILPSIKMLRLNEISNEVIEIEKEIEEQKNQIE